MWAHSTNRGAERPVAGLTTNLTTTPDTRYRERAAAVIMLPDHRTDVGKLSSFPARTCPSPGRVGFATQGRGFPRISHKLMTIVGTASLRPGSCAQARQRCTTVPGGAYDCVAMFRIHPVLRRARRAFFCLASRLWNDGPAALMAAYLMLVVAAEAIARSASLVFKYGWIPVVAFFCWRVTRGGHVSRGILIYTSVVNLLWAAQLAQWWHIQAVAALVITLGGLVLLLSPAVYTRTHPGAGAASASIRLWPRRWMILSAPLAGTAVAGLTLAMARRWFLPGSGCMIAPVEGLPQHCVGSGRGFPVPVTATVHGYHAMSQLAFVQDCVQWTVLIFTISYLVWLALHRRHPPLPAAPADAGLIAQPSQ